MATIEKGVKAKDKDFASNLEESEEEMLLLHPIRPRKTPTCTDHSHLLSREESRSRSSYFQARRKMSLQPGPRNLSPLAKPRTVIYNVFF